MPTPCSSCLSQNPICLALPPYLPPMYRTNSVLFSWIVFPHTPHFTSLLLFPHPSCHFQTSRINYLNSSLPLFHQAFPLIICECIPPPEVPKTELQSHLWPVRHMLPNWTSCNDANVLYLHFLVATGHTWLLNTWNVQLRPKSESVVHFATPWTAAHQAPLSVDFFRQEHWSGLPFPSPGDLSDPGSNPGLPPCRQILYHLSHQGSPEIEKLNF